MKSLIGFQLETSNGSFGKLEAIRFETDRWAATDFLIDTRQWFRRSQVRLPAKFIESIDRKRHTLHTKLSRADVVEAQQSSYIPETIPIRAGAY
ncbi:hypothetical protein [Pelagicoccus sp. SDUM812003]|uniref:hypothetical protein n=1 Tax=Pelagicoccus sp. SDUM812003 TaxID=3041267 RepID=UPI00280ECFE4|nr:hypothetical protein [Pelagicoccus sp. SDUM812003]MDQ8204301.1 hypothetical protein [Pelagicoccus sp. SDUM812003]